MENSDLRAGACFLGMRVWGGGEALVFSNSMEATRRRRLPDRVFAKWMKPLNPSSLVRLFPA